MKQLVRAGAVATAATLIAAPALAQSRDQIQIAGSSTVLPYAAIVAEAFGENFDFPTPVVASGGSSAGLQQFCEGVGLETIDIVNSSRPIRDTEIESCFALRINTNRCIGITCLFEHTDGICTLIPPVDTNYCQTISRHKFLKVAMLLPA